MTLSGLKLCTGLLCYVLYMYLMQSHPSCSQNIPTSMSQRPFLQVFPFTLWVYFHRHLPVNRVRWENKAYFLAVTPSESVKKLCRKSNIKSALWLFSLFYWKYWRETPSPGSNMSHCLCQCSSERERSDANWMRNSLMRWSDDRIRLTWKLEGVHVWVHVCQTQYCQTWNHCMDAALW